MKPDSATASRFLLIGATLLPLGIAAGATGLRTAAAIVTLSGAAVLIAGLHTFGRAGADEGDPGETARPSKNDRD